MENLIVNDDPIAALKSCSDPNRAQHSQRYFKTGPGEYAEGDQFLGNSVPQVRKLAKQHRHDSLAAIRAYIQSPYHEVRLFGLLCLVYRYEKANDDEQEKIYKLYVSQFKYINNWDLVDSSAHKIIGAYLMHRERDMLYRWARSRTIWTRRIAILSCFAFIPLKQFDDALAIAEILLSDKEDLIHKAVGWMLREIGKRDRKCLDKFLQAHYQNMPRTMLRYAIEKHPPASRQAYLKASI